MRVLFNNFNHHAFMQSTGTSASISNNDSVSTLKSQTCPKVVNDANNNNNNNNNNDNADANANRNKKNSLTNLSADATSGVVKSRSLTIPDLKLDLEASMATANLNKWKNIYASVADASKEATNQNNKSAWNILCQIINCKVAFKKQYNGRKYNWIQLAGHAGRFKPGDREGFILKLMDNLERKCLDSLQTDCLADFVPKIDKVLFDKEDGKYYTEMQDLLYGFDYPSIMDIKIGIRTFLENDSDEKETKPRSDLYERLIEIAPDEPTDEEHRLKAITKRRYMSWREKSTCSATLGFRIEAIKKNQVFDKEFYNVKEKKQVQYHFRNYTDNKKHIMKMYLDRLVKLKEHLAESPFFHSHEMIGSSLLFVHDTQKANIWMIDFGKTRPLPQGITITHSAPWIDGNHEDGYLIGIQSLIDLFQEAIST